MDKELNAYLEGAKHLVFFTGAGISTDSGVPDYRSPNGVWSRYEPVYYDDFISSHDARIRYWTMKRETFSLYSHVQPNPSHFLIADYEKRGNLLGVITQNVDGLHRIAGHSDDRLIELHGTDRSVRCLTCFKRYEASLIFSSINMDPFDPPVCSDCGGYLKPATISFGQPLNQDHVNRAEEMATHCDVFVVLGSSLVVYPAASLPILAKNSGAKLVIINRDKTPLDSQADLVLNGQINHLFTR